MFFLSYRNLAMNPKGAENADSSEDQFAESVNGSAVTHLAQMAMGISAVFILVKNRSNARFCINGRFGWLFLGFVGWAFISVVWAENLPLTLQRLAGLGIICIASAAVVHRLSIHEIVLWTFFSTTLFLLIGIAAELVAGTFHPLSFGYRFAGSLGPNDQGVECGVLLLSAIAAADFEKQRRILFWCTGFLGFVFLILCGSRTALFSTLLAVTVYQAVVRSRRTKVVTTLSACTLLSLILLLLGAGLLPSLKSALFLGRDDPDNVDSFAGRTMIWRDVAPYISERPILGYGYGGFWTARRINLFSEEENHGVPNGHSTYIDYLLNLGGVGAAAY